MNNKQTKFPIRSFNLDNMCKHPSIFILGKRGSGKTNVINAILQKYKNIQHKIIISAREGDNIFYSIHHSDAHIYSKYNPDIIEKLLLRQKETMNYNHKKRQQTIDLHKNSADEYINMNDDSMNKNIMNDGTYNIDESSDALIIFDDCLMEKKEMENKKINELLFNARHQNITYVIAMQYPSGIITPEMRANFDYVFLFSEDYIPSLKRIWKNYAGIFPDFSSFHDVHKQVTEDYNVMVIKNKGNYTDFFDKIAHYKAPNLYDNNIDQKQIIIKNISSNNNFVNEYESLNKNSIKIDVISDINTDELSIISKDEHHKKSSKRDKIQCRKLLQRYQTNQEILLKLIDKYEITNNDSILHNSLIINLKNQAELLCIYKYCLQHNI